MLTRQKNNGADPCLRKKRERGRSGQRVCRSRKLVARGNWTKICPFAIPKPLPYFPNALVGGKCALIDGIPGEMGNAISMSIFVDAPPTGADPSEMAFGTNRRYTDGLARPCNAPGDRQCPNRWVESVPRMSANRCSNSFNCEISALCGCGVIEADETSNRSSAG